MSTAANLAAKPSLTLKRRLNAPPAKVFAAWAEPEKLARWFGPVATEIVLAETDLRVGGKFRIVMQGTEEQHDVSGVYREVVPNEKLVFTWSWRSTPERESLVTVALKPDGDGTLLTLTHEQFFDELARDRHNTGWAATLGKLDAYLATS
jgi:uncharacterized protein YndB with AHSA1/START domain